MYILNYSSWNIILFQNSGSKILHLQSYTQAIQTICYMLYLLVPSRETVALKNKIEKQRLCWIIPVFGWSLSGVPYHAQVLLITIHCFRNIILLPKNINQYIITRMCKFNILRTLLWNIFVFEVFIDVKEQIWFLLNR